MYKIELMVTMQALAGKREVDLKGCSFGPRTILNQVCKILGLSIKEVRAKCRKRKYVEARCIIVYLLRNYSDLTLRQIAAYVGLSDHSTVIYNSNLYERLMETDHSFIQKADLVNNLLNDYPSDLYNWKNIES